MLDGVTSPRKPVEARDTVVIRFAGDSGDGMQVTGMQFTTESALAGNDLATLPDFPAEIRAPAGTLAGVSAFQLNFSSHEVFTPGDDLDVLVAMNPAALKMNVGDLKSGGILIVDREGFNEQNLKKAEYESNPLEDGSLRRYQLFQAEVTKLTMAALKDLGLSARSVFRCRNFFCLGMTSWLYHRPIEPAEAWIKERFKKTPEVVEANVRALRAGFNFAENAALFSVSYETRPAAIAITTTSGPGMNLKAETVGLALAVELPIVVTDIQRAGPSAGMPTKTEQADLLMAMYGRHGESPVPVLAAATPADCFLMAFEAVRIAVKYMTPVVLLTDGYLANGAEPWLIPDPATLPEVPVALRP